MLSSCQLKHHFLKEAFPYSQTRSARGPLVTFSDHPMLFLQQSARFVIIQVLKGNIRPRTSFPPGKGRPMRAGWGCVSSVPSRGTAAHHGHLIWSLCPAAHTLPSWTSLGQQARGVGSVAPSNSILLREKWPLRAEMLSQAFPVKWKSWGSKTMQSAVQSPTRDGQKNGSQP